MIRQYQHPDNAPLSLSNNKVISIFEDSQGMLWLTTSLGVNKFNPRTEAFTHFKHDPNDKESLSSNHSWYVGQMTASTLWVSTFGGLDIINTQTNAVSQFALPLSEDVAFSVITDSRGKIWIGTQDSGLMDLTPAEAIRCFRLRKATQLLTEGHSVGKVAFEIGFNSHSYFSQCFKAQYGCMPSQYLEGLAGK
jgi:ligand-binding sensor domain-containing protein